MKEEQINKIKENLIAKASPLDNAGKASFFLGARVLSYAMHRNGLLGYEDWDHLSDMLGAEVDKHIKLAKQ